MVLNIQRFYREIKNIIQVSIFQPICRVCGSSLVFQEEEIICNDCKNKINMVRVPVCERCGKFLKVGDVVLRHGYNTTCLYHLACFEEMFLDA